MHEFNPPWHLSGAWDRNDFWSNCSLLSPLHFKHSLLLVGVAKQVAVWNVYQRNAGIHKKFHNSRATVSTPASRIPLGSAR